jgi:dephospho-CoA kinase
VSGVLRVGLTGGIACGKSHVLRRLSARGLATVDLDAVAHAVMAPGGQAYSDVVAAFGPGILAADGTIDRQALGARVFADPTARARLDSLVHPRVRAEEARRSKEQEAEGGAVLVSDAALLVEAGAHLRFDRIVVVHCPPGEQLRRLVERDGLTEALARARIEAQMPVDEKRRFAHVVIDASSGVEETEAAADRLAEDLREIAARPRLARSPLRQEALGALVHGSSPGPRGLDPATLATEALAAGGLELGGLALRLRPPASGPWYRAAAPDEGAPWPEALAAVLGLWSLARGLDDEWLASAAASLARMTHADASAVSGGCLAALLARDVAGGLPLEALAGRLVGREPLARRWGGAPPPKRIASAAGAASAHPGDPAGARRAAEAARAEPALAGALVGLAGGVAPAGVDASLLVVAQRLSAA